MERVGCHEFFVQFAAFLFKYAAFDFASGLAEHPDSSSAHFFERVGASDYYARDAFADYELAARRCLAIVRAWLKGYIECRFFQ